MKIKKIRKYIAVIMAVVITVVNIYYADYTNRVEKTAKEENMSGNFAYEIPENITISGLKLEETKLLMEKVSTSLKTGDKENLEKGISAFQEKISELQGQVKEDSENTLKEMQVLGLETGVQRQIDYSEKMEESFSQLEDRISAFKERLKTVSDEMENEELKKEWENIQNLYNPEQPQQVTGDVLPYVNLKADSSEPSMEQGITPAYFKMSEEGTIRPQSEDTILSEETAWTDNLNELANTINTPVTIYEYVRNEIDFEPYYGLRKGASGTFYEKAGNDMDQASLMIALLRHAGYPARYVSGTVEVSMDKAMKWTGTTSSETAVKFMASIGIPVTAVKQGGKIEYIRMEHTWVETYVPYEYYRGTDGSQGESLWIPLDPSFKQYEIVEGLDLAEVTGISKDDMQASVVGNGEKSADEYIITHVDNKKGMSLLQKAEEKLEAYIKDNGLESADVRELIGGKKIEVEQLGILPNVLPYNVVNVQWENALIPKEYKETVSFSIGGAQAFSLNFGGEKDFEVEYSAYELYGKRIVLEWDAASIDDRQIIESYGGLDKTPSYLVRLIPRLKADGEEVAAGKPVQAGYRQQFTITMHHTGMDRQEIENPVIAGGIYAVGLDFGSISLKETQEKKEEMESLADKVTEQNMNSDEVLGTVLDSMAKVYFGQLDAYNEIIENTVDVQASRLVSEAMTGYQPKVLYLFQTPSEFKGGSFYIDVDHDAVSVTGNSGNKEDETAYMLQAGMLGSAMEHGIFEQTMEVPSVSTIKVLEEANSRGIPIYTLGKENKDRIDELQVSEAVRKDISNAIEGGKTVVIPQEEITYGEWKGSGYIIYDTSTGAAGYMISGGIAGGSVAFDLVIGTVAVINLIWAMVDMYMVLGAFMAATNPILCIVYYSLFLLTVWTIIDTMYNVMMYFETGQYEYGLRLLGDLVLNVATMGLTKLFEKIVPAMGKMLKNIAGKINGTADIVARLGDDITGAVLRHGGDDALKRADDLVRSIRGVGVGDDLIKEVAEQGGVKALDALEQVLKKGVGKDVIERLLREGYNLNTVNKLLDLGIHPMQYADYGIKNSTEAKWIEYLVGGHGYNADDIKYLARIGIEPSNYKNLGIYGPEQAQYLVSLSKKLKNAGMGDNLIEQVVKSQGSEGLEKVERLVAKGVDGATVEELLKEGYQVDTCHTLLDRGIHPGDYGDYGIKTPYDAEKAKKLIVDEGHGIDEVKGLLEGGTAIKDQLINKIKQIRANMPNANLSKRGNMAAAEVNISGVKNSFVAHSKINASVDKGANVADFSYLKSVDERIFTSYVEDKFPRYHDTEAKILEDIASKIEDRNISGTINLYSELPCCQSCSNIILEFKRMYPNIKLNVYVE